MDTAQYEHVAIGLVAPIAVQDILRSAAVTGRAIEDLRVQLLGGFSVSVGSRLVDDAAWYLRKAKSLLKILALAPQHRLHREQIMEMLWPDLDSSAAANNLHKALHVARRVLEPSLPSKGSSSYLQLQQDFVMLVLPGASRIDAEAFALEAQAARLAQDPDVYEAALRLYAGDLLPEDRSEDWVAGRRETLKALQSSLLLELAALYERHDQVDKAIEALRQAVANDPVNEDAHMRLMRLLARTGQRSLALRHYRQLCEALRRDLDATPDPQIQALYQRILNGERESEQQTLPVPPATAPSLPARRVEGLPLIGRDQEIATLKEHVDRLLTGCGGLVLVRGEGGIGKSRLAAEARDYAARHRMLSLWGAASPHEGPFAHSPLAVALRAFAERATGADGTTQPAILARKLAGFVRAGDSPRGSELREGDRVSAEGRELTRAVEDFFSHLAATAPVLVVLDDLHLAGETTLDLLWHLAGAMRETPVLFVGTYRSDAADSDGPLARLVSHLQHERLASCLHLPRLSFSATVSMVMALLGGSVENIVFERVYALASGNPHYTAEAVQAMRGRGQLQVADGRWRLHLDTRLLPSSTFLRHPGKR